MLSHEQIEATEDELYKLNLVVLAAEDWSESYHKDKPTFAKLIKLEATMERVLRRYFRDLSDNAQRFIDPSAYVRELYRRQGIQAATSDDFNVDVILKELEIEDSDQTFLKIVFDLIAEGAAVGAASGEQIYNRYLGMTSTSAEIQRFAREQAAYLVGKKVGKDGTIVDNPNAKYKISNTTREDIRSSLRTSLSLGEDQAAAVERLRSAIKNPRRAELIAQTEAVNAYQGGLLAFGEKSGATGKESQALNTSDMCADFARQGVVSLNYLYGGQWLGPSYHPRCRCGLRLIYPEGAQ